jgi:1-acyl-sn-glycerol-3-phosphate acyltransferase
VLPVKVRMRGIENIPTDGRFLLVSNHLDNIDPAVFYYCFPKSQMAFVGKKETKNMFLVNKIMPKLLCPTIDRENDREALKSILRCISLLKNDTVSIAIFPEGRINKYRKLAHFRPGVFKIAQKANVPIVVCTLQNTQNVLKRLLQFKGSTVDVHLLEVILAESLQGRTTVDIAEQVYGIMAADLGPENTLTPEEEENA